MCACTVYILCTSQQVASDVIEHAMVAARFKGYQTLENCVDIAWTVLSDVILLSKSWMFLSF